MFDLFLKNEVGGMDFDPDYVDFVLARFSKHPEDFIQCFDIKPNNSEDDKDEVNTPVRVLISSLGGRLHSALRICDSFRRHGNVSVHFSGMNASAATIAGLGAKHVSIDRNALYLVHKCSVLNFDFSNMNADELRERIAEMQQSASDLDKFDLTVAGMYAERCKKPVADLLDIMKKGEWLTADEALELGFVDAITDEGEAAPVLTNSIAASLCAANIPLPPLSVADNNPSGFWAQVANLFGSQRELKSLRTEVTTLKAEVADKANAYNDACSTVEAQKATIAELHLQIDELNKQIVSLNDLVAELRAMPGDDSFEVLKDKPAADEGRNDYFAVLNRARDLEKQLNGFGTK